MQIATDKLNELNIQSSGKVTEMKLDGESQAMIFQMFTGGLYSDPVGTVIREITSNCFDSHIEAKVDSAKNPVIVELGNDVSGHFISFTDRGVGMSPDRIENIYGTYFKSTKRATNNQIGGFGLGGKTPLAYTESFYIITRFEGIEYVYNVFEGNNVPAIELMSQTSTDKPNGTTVKVPVKQYDVSEFEQKTLRQLYYFENIVFKGFSDRYVTNEYQIVKGKNFLFRGDSYGSYLHACYGKVAYPLDFDALGLNQHDYQIPVAIKLDIGELEGTGVTPSREALKYSKNNVRIIKAKIEAVMDEMKELLSKQYVDVKNLEDYYKATENFGTLYFENGQKVYLRNLIKKSEVSYPNFKFNGFSIPSTNEIINDLYNVKLYGKKFSSRSWRNTGEWHSHDYAKMDEISNIYYTDGEFKRVILKQSYLRTLSSSENFYVMSPKTYTPELEKYLLRKYGALQEVLGTNTLDEPEFENVIPKGKAVKMLKALIKDVHSTVQKYNENYNEVEVTEEFIESRKKQRLSKEMLNTTIPMKCKTNWNSERVTLKQLKAIKGKIYYGFQDDENKLSDASTILSRSSKNAKALPLSYIARTRNRYNKPEVRGTMFVRISKGNEKYMKMLGKKAIHVDHFYKTFVSRKIDKLVETKVAYNLQNKYERNIIQFIQNDRIMKHICPETLNKVKDVENYFRGFNFDSVWNLDEGAIKRELGIDLTKMQTESPIAPVVNELIDLSQKNENRLKWFSLPYHIEIEREDHKELIEMIKLMFEK